MLRKKNVKRVLAMELKIVFVIFILVLIFHDYIRTHIKPPVMDFVSTHIELLKFLILFVLIFCSLFLILIIWLLEWGDKNKQLPLTRYVSQLVCDNYYGDYRKTDIYKAIKTTLSKYSRDEYQDEKSDQRKMNQGFSGRYVDPVVFSPKAFAQKTQTPQETNHWADGTHKTYYKNGNLEKEFTYKDNKLEGVYRTYYEDARLHQERHYKEGKLDGLYRAFDEYGILYFDITYKADKQEGISNTYYKSGVLQYRDTFKAGKRINRESYNESGQLIFRQDENV